MGFSADKQTLEDLNILGKYKNHSIFNLFCHTHTRGGEKLLDTMFLNPLTDANQINQRSDIFDFFAQNRVEFPLDDSVFKTADHFLSNSGKSTILRTFFNILRCKFMHLFASDKEYGLITDGITASCSMIMALRKFTDRLLAHEHKNIHYHNDLKAVYQTLNGKYLSWVQNVKPDTTLSLMKVVKYDHILRAKYRQDMSKIMNFVYQVDVATCVGNIAITRGFVRAKALDYGSSILNISGLYHPQVPNAVSNDLRIDSEHNIYFLTGANMAGKSTLMKSVGVAVYLAHMGFPVAVRSMEFSVLDGIYSSINVSDNLNLGISHFYAEVLRVKKVAQAVSESQNLLVIFDELFKGTNVKDAYDATVAVTEAFSLYCNCSFIISTHITEAGYALKPICQNMRCYYMPTVMDGVKPIYPYQLKEGITTDRHGMMIINNERIVEIIRGI